jgi:hypothetical protein
MKRFLHNIVERIKSRCDGRRQTVYDLSWDQSGVELRWLTIENERGSVSFLWESVSAVDTFKLDLWSFDCICLSFKTPDGWIEVNEHMKGWDDFLDVAESSLPGFPPHEKWWKKVAFPPFETNQSTLWTRTVPDTVSPLRKEV